MNNEKYSDIINLPRHTSKKYPRMSIYKRAAQFAPFAALTGYSDAVNETSRITNKKIDISEDMKSAIDLKLQIINENIRLKPEITVLYFEKDKLKSGGRYIEYKGNVKKVDNIDKKIMFLNKTISFEDIYNILSENLKI